MLTGIITFILTTVFMYNYYQKQDKYVVFQGQNLLQTSELDRIVNGLKKIIDQKFLGEVDENKLIQYALKGYVAGLDDKYSAYYTPDEINDMNAALLGNYVGVGAYLQADTETNVIKVLMPIEGSPAEEAGIKTGDIIKKVDGVEYDGTQITQAATAMKGKEGTTVNLEILRDDEIKTFTLTRRNIKIYKVLGEVIEGNIGYIQIQSFDEGTAKEFIDKYNELKEKGIKSLVIDLRNNGGGVVTEALDIVDYMLEKDKVELITVDKSKTEEVSKSKNEPIIKIPVSVLVNKQTASASEIMAGALKDNNRAKIVGTKTYGKGVIQQLMYLANGAALKLTTNEYYTPNRNKINEIGIEPDYLVELTGEEDLQLKKAIELVK